MQNLLLTSTETGLYLIFDTMRSTEFEEMSHTLAVDVVELILYVHGCPNMPSSGMVRMIECKAAKWKQTLKKSTFWVVLLPCSLKLEMKMFDRCFARHFLHIHMEKKKHE